MNAPTPLGRDGLPIPPNKLPRERAGRPARTRKSGAALSGGAPFTRGDRAPHVLLASVLHPVALTLDRARVYPPGVRLTEAGELADPADTFVYTERPAAWLWACDRAGLVSWLSPGAAEDVWEELGAERVAAYRHRAARLIQAAEAGGHG